MDCSIHLGSLIRYTKAEKNCKLSVKSNTLSNINYFFILALYQNEEISSKMALMMRCIIPAKYNKYRRCEARIRKIQFFLLFDHIDSIRYS